jgi:hypothetical protein
MTCRPEGGCWCAELPHCVPMPAGKGEGCLCRNCLLAKMEALKEAFGGTTKNDPLPWCPDG